MSWTLRPMHPDDRRWVTDYPARAKILEAFARLKEDPEEAGVPLKDLKPHQVQSRGLGDCMVCKIVAPYEDEVRIVYRIHPEEREVEVVAVGRRMRSEVYRLAADRLHAEEEKEEPRWKRLDRLRRLGQLRG